METSAERGQCSIVEPERDLCFNTNWRARCRHRSISARCPLGKMLEPQRGLRSLTWRPRSSLYGTRLPKETLDPVDIRKSSPAESSQGEVMKCLYYPAPTLDCAQQVSDDLHALGLEDFYLHVITKDEAGLRQRNIHSSNYLETLDLIRDGLIGCGVGFFTGLMGAGLLKIWAPFGPTLPRIAYFATVAGATLFGAWEGGLMGIASENSKLAGFHDDIERGGCLILIYAPEAQEAAITKMMRARHPEAGLAAIDSHFINPFSAVQRRAEALLPQAGLLQRD
jgi:hypothetical protein